MESAGKIQYRFYQAITELVTMEGAGESEYLRQGLFQV